MKDRELSGFYRFLAQPLFFRARFVVGALSVLLAAAFAFPLWRVEIAAPQYPRGLTLEVYAHALESGHGGADLRDLNVLHQFFGMRALDDGALGDLAWLPFALGLLVILGLRCAAIGEVRSLIDLVVTSLYVAAFTLVRFALVLRRFGELDPDAPVKVAPFTPPMVGTATAGEVTSHASFGLGTWFALAFGLGILATLVVHLVRGRRAQAAEPEQKA